MDIEEKGKSKSVSNIQIKGMKNRTILKWFCAIILIVIVYKIQKTRYNWDVVFYCGAIFNDPEHPDASRKAMINAFKNSSYIEYKKDIEPKTQYGKDVFNNNKSYEEQYAFYGIRIVYIKTIQAFHSLGIDAVYSVYLASLFYALLAVITLYFFCFTQTNNVLFSFLISLFVILKSDFKEFITSSPDSLSAFSLILVIIAYFSKKNWFIYTSVAFSIICRTDNIIFVGLLYGSTLVQNIINKENLKLSGISIIISLIIYFVINFFYHNAGYRVLYFHTFVEHLSFPLTNPQIVSYNEILNRLIPEIPYFIYPVMYLLALLIIVKGNYRIIFSNPALLVSLVAIFTFVIRFCLFPSSQARFIFQYEFIGILAVIYYFKDSLYLFFNSEKQV